MKLHGSYTSPFVRHCRVALLQTGIDFEFVETDYDKSAAESATSKVPYLHAGGLTLTDSAVIVRYIREKADQPFLSTLDDHELFAMTSTALDASINVFLLELNGFTDAQITYLKRQKERIQSALAELNRRMNPEAALTTDSALRCACFIDWALFRKRFTLDGLPGLERLLAVANESSMFTSTAPSDA